MICPKCGKEIPDNSKFCDYCGSEITIPAKVEEVPDEILVELAEGYTANTAAAKEIAQAANGKDNGMKAVRESAIAYLKTKDPDLFQEKYEFVQGKEELTSIDNLEDALRPLTYEERIVVLMTNVEKLSVDEIASELSITTDDVHAILQSAFTKVYPEGKKAVQPAPVSSAPQSEEKVDPVKAKAIKKGTKAAKKKPFQPKKVTKEKHSSQSKLSLKVKIIVVAVLAVILGGWLGIRNFAIGQYNQGLASLEKEDYESAIKEFSNAVQWWSGKEDANKQLSLAYAGSGDYTKAAEKLEKYISSTGTNDENDTLASYYCILAKDAADSEDYKTAAENYEKAYALNNDEFTNIKLQACQNEGTYTDANGITYNINGQITTLAVDENGYKYNVSLNYENGLLTSFNASSETNSAKTSFDKFQSSYEDAVICIYPSSNVIRYYVHEDVNENKENYYSQFRKYLFEKATTRDNTGNIKKVTKKNQETGEILTYEYSYVNGILASIHTTSSASEDAWIEEFTYDDNGRLIERTISRNLLSTVEHETYAYDDNGNCIRKIIERKELTREETLMPYAEYSITDYTYTTSGELYSATISDKNGTIVARGYGIPDNGIVYVFTAEESE